MAEKRWSCAEPGCTKKITHDEGEYVLTNQKHHGTDVAVFKCKEHADE